MRKLRLKIKDKDLDDQIDESVLRQQLRDPTVCPICGTAADFGNIYVGDVYMSLAAPRIRLHCKICESVWVNQYQLVEDKVHVINVKDPDEKA